MEMQKKMDTHWQTVAAGSTPINAGKNNIMTIPHPNPVTDCVNPPATAGKTNNKNCIGTPYINVTNDFLTARMQQHLQPLRSGNPPDVT